MYTYDYIISKEARKELVNYFINKIDEQSFSKLVEGEIPKYLYKYSGVSKYSINNIINGEFTATRPTEFNDLYDSAMHFDNVKDTKREFEEAEKIFNEFGMANLITNEMKERQLKHANRKDKYSLDYLTKEFRIACLTSNSTSITMWSHYAHDNTGICVEYDTRLINEKHLSSLYPVTYIDSPFIVSELCRNMDNLNFAILLSIVTKFKDWEYEDEWRILLYSFNSRDDRIQLIGMPIKSIILGNKFIKQYQIADRNEKNFELYGKLFSFIIDNKIKLKVVKPQIRSFQLELDEIETSGLSGFDDLCDWR